MFLRKRHKTLRKRCRFFVFKVIPAYLRFYRGPCLSVLSGLRIKLCFQGAIREGTFPIISRSSLFTDWPRAGLNILIKLKREKTTLKKPHERMMYLPCNTRNFFKAIDKATGKIIAYLLAMTKAKSVGVNKNPCRDLKHIQAMVITEICRP